MIILYRSIIVVCFLQSLPLHGAAQQSALPWLKNIDPKEQVNKLHSLRTEAAVSVSDGLKYQTSTLFHDKQRAVFQQAYTDRTIVRGVEGRYIWAYDGHGETEAGSGVEAYVLGHQFQAQILFFDKIQDSLMPAESAVFTGKNCQMLAGSETQSTYKFYYDPAALPLGMEIITAEGDTIAFTFEDWRLGGVV